MLGFKSQLFRSLFHQQPPQPPQRCPFNEYSIMFDAARLHEAPLHDVEAQDRDSLERAAYLHSVPETISYLLSEKGMMNDHLIQYHSSCHFHPWKLHRQPPRPAEHNDVFVRGHGRGWFCGDRLRILLRWNFQQSWPPQRNRTTPVYTAASSISDNNTAAATPSRHITPGGR